MTFMHAMLAQAGDTAPDGSFWGWLLGAERIDPTHAASELGWGLGVPAWGWALIVLAIAAFSVIVYRRLLGNRPARVALAVTRGLLLLWLAALLCQPMLVLSREQLELDHVLMLVDRSASMTIEDVATLGDGEGDVGLADRQSREQQWRGLFARHAADWAALEDRHHVQWFGFDRQLAALASPEATTPPDGELTAMRSAIHRALRRVAGKPVSAVVVFSDGRSTESIDAATIDRVNRLGASVFTVPLGASVTPTDLAVTRIDFPELAFTDDNVPIRAWIGVQAGREDIGEPRGLQVRLVDEATGEALDTAAVRTWGEPVTLMTTAEATGVRNWRVELVGGEDELIVENNRRTLQIELVDRPIRVLYVDGYPRWEYRYLKNTLAREQSIESSIMLISADRTFAQEGDVPLRRLPREADEIADYDVIVIGDVPADFFSPAQLELFRDHVAVTGAGLMWLAGERDTPGSYASTLLADLLPMRQPSVVGALSPPLSMRPTPAAEALGVLQLRQLGGADSASRWPDELPDLLWGQVLGELKPAVEPLAIAGGVDEPLVTRMRYGAGQAIYVATDEIWRWRYAHGELYPEQFWMQLLRLAGRTRLRSGAGDSQRARLAISHRRAAVGDTVVVELDVTDQSLLGPTEGSVPVTVTLREGRAGGPGGAIERLRLASTARPGRFRATWTPRQAGPLELRVDDPVLGPLDLSRTIEVERISGERSDPATDHALLASLSEQTGGRMLRPDEAGQLAGLIPNRARRTADDITEPLWNSPLAFVVALLLLTGEWIGRKALRLA